LFLTIFIPQKSLSPQAPLNGLATPTDRLQALLFLSRFLVLQQDLFLQDEFELAVELLFVSRTHDRCAELFERVENLGIHIKSDKVRREPLMVLFGLLFEPWQENRRRESRVAHAIGDDEDVFARQRGFEHGLGGGIERVAQRGIAIRTGKSPGPVFQRVRVKRSELDRFTSGWTIKHEQTGLNPAGSAGGGIGGKGLDLPDNRDESAVGDNVFRRILAVFVANGFFHAAGSVIDNRQCDTFLLSGLQAGRTSAQRQQRSQNSKR